MPYAKLIIIICFIQSCHFASAQYVVSFEESCQGVNEAQVYEAFYLSFGVDSAIKIIGACPLTGVNVFVDSMCAVVDVIVRNNCKTVEEKVNKRLLRAMMSKNMTFHDCYEPPLLFPPIKKEKADTIKIEDSRHLSDFFKNRIPINIFLSSARFLDWLRKHHTDGISIEEDSTWLCIVDCKLLYHADHLGSTSYVTDKDGYATQFVSYKPYGEALVD